MRVEAARTPNGRDDSLSDGDRKRGIRRTVLWLSLLAFAFYAGFILLGVLNSR